MKIEISEARDTLKHIGKHIKVHEEHGLIYTAQLVKSLEIADSALEKQTPKEIIKWRRIPGIGKCPVCKTDLVADPGDSLWCPDCGQAVYLPGGKK
jgi:hypothetical protein